MYPSIKLHDSVCDSNYTFHENVVRPTDTLHTADLCVQTRYNPATPNFARWSLSFVQFAGTSVVMSLYIEKHTHMSETILFSVHLGPVIVRVNRSKGGDRVVLRTKIGSMTVRVVDNRDNLLTDMVNDTAVPTEDLHRIRTASRTASISVKDNLYYGLLFSLARVDGDRDPQWWKQCFDTWHTHCPDLFARARVEFGARYIHLTKHRLAAMSDYTRDVFVRRLAQELSPVDAFHHTCAAIRFVRSRVNKDVFGSTDVLTVVANVCMQNAYAIPHPRWPALVLDPIVCSVDTVGHEVGHLVVDRAVPGGLRTQAEAGAIHESCGDVFGYGTERYVYAWYRRRSIHLVGKADWDIGEDDTAVPVRTMAKPSLSHSAMRIPLTVDQLDGWYNGTDDDVFIHTNCSVGSYCFYRVCQALRSETQTLRLWYAVLCTLSSSATYREFAARLCELEPRSRDIVSDLRLLHKPPRRGRNKTLSL